MNINTKKLRVSTKNSEMLIGARARAISHGNLPENRPIWPEITFFKIFVRLAPKYIYIVKITFLAQILNVFPLYGWCLPLTLVIFYVLRINETKYVLSAL